MHTASTGLVSGTHPVQAVAHGRVNLMGEHTDYNGGFVLPVAIPQRASVTLTPRDDRQVCLSSRQLGPADPYELGSERRTGRWWDYVQGLTVELARRGHPPAGFRAELDSDVPAGAGLSSSAALELAFLRALRSAFALPMDDLTLAQVAQRAESDFVGAPVGIMDQMVASLGTPGNVMLIDTENLAVGQVSLPESLELVVIASGVTHHHDAGEYKVRRSECEEAARLLDVPNLRAVPLTDLSRVDALPALLARRARHVITENERVLRTVRALEDDDHHALYALFLASHESQRDDFEVSVRAIDRLVELALEEPHIVAARLTGGGFGGSVVALAQRGHGFAAAHRVAQRYAEALPFEPQVLLPRGADHAGNS